MKDTGQALPAFGLTPAGAVPVTDRGLAYGDGLFETIAVVNGVPKLLHGHLARLQQGLERLRVTGVALPAIASAIGEAAAAVGGEGALKLMLTRGDAPRGYAPPENANPRWWLQAFPWTCPTEPAAGARVAVSTVRLGEQPLLAGLKHLNRLEQVLARAEYPPAVADEALMLDGAGRVVCATAANVFAVKKGQVFTPDLTRCGVAGVVRSALLTAGGTQALPWAFTTTDLTLDWLLAADEVFLTSALRGVWPVAMLSGQTLPTGPVTQACFRFWSSLP